MKKIKAFFSPAKSLALILVFILALGLGLLAWHIIPGSLFIIWQLLALYLFLCLINHLNDMASASVFKSLILSLLKDINFKTRLFLLFNLFIAAYYVISKIIHGLYYRQSFDFLMAFYYAFLTAIYIYITKAEKRYEACDKETKDLYAYRCNRRIAILMILLNIPTALLTGHTLYLDNNLWNHIGITIYETIISFLLGTLIGTFIASILWWFPFLAKVLDPYLTILNSLPKVALGPIIIIWAGAGMTSIILMALLISLIITIINVYQGFVETDPNKIKLMKSFRATKWQIFSKLILPSTKPTIINALKINVSMSLIGVIMGEFLVSKEGIGYLITYGSQVFNLDLVMSGVIILCLVATMMYYCVLWIEKKFH